MPPTIKRRQNNRYTAEFREWCCLQIAASDNYSFGNDLLNRMRKEGGFPNLGKPIVIKWWNDFKTDKDRIEALASVKRTEVALRTIEAENTRLKKQEKTLKEMTASERIESLINKISLDLETKDAGSQARLNMVKELEGLMRIQKQMTLMSPEIQDAVREYIELCKAFGSDPVRGLLMIVSKMRDQQRMGIMRKEEELANVPPFENPDEITPDEDYDPDAADDDTEEDESD